MKNMKKKKSHKFAGKCVLCTFNLKKNHVPFMFITINTKCKWSIFYFLNLFHWHRTLHMQFNFMKFSMHFNVKWQFDECWLKIMINLSKMQYCYQIMVIELIILKWMMELSQKLIETTLFHFRTTNLFIDCSIEVHEVYLEHLGNFDKYMNGYNDIF